MNAIVRGIDVGFGNTKFVTASANGKVDCAHFASLAFFGHTDEVADSMGEKRRTVQVPVDGLFYEVGPDVELAAERFRSRQLHDGYTQTPESRAFTIGALPYMKVQTVDPRDDRNLRGRQEGEQYVRERPDLFQPGEGAPMSATEPEKASRCAEFRKKRRCASR